MPQQRQMVVFKNSSSPASISLAPTIFCDPETITRPGPVRPATARGPEGHDLQILVGGGARFSAVMIAGDLACGFFRSS